MKKIYLIAVSFILSVVFTVSTVKTVAQPADALHTNVGFSYSANTTLGILTTGDAEIDGYIVASCARHKVDPLLVYAQMTQESNFKEKATSYKGASGLMQLMPDTAMRFGVTNIYDPQQNIEGGVKYISWLLDKFDGDVELALAAYNAGEGSVMKYDNQIPPYRETQDYVARITTHYEKIKIPNSIPNIPAVNHINHEIAKVM